MRIVKLHSDLRILTKLQLVGVGVDFVFPLEGRKEGRKEPSLGQDDFQKISKLISALIISCIRYQN